MFTKRQLLGGAALAASAAISGLSPARAAATSRSGFFAAKDIAEAGFIFGLPIVMNYAVMYEFVINKNSGQYKAPFNATHNESRRLHLQGHRRRHAEQRHAVFLRCGWTCAPSRMVISVPAVEKERYYSVQLCDGNTFNYGYIGSRATGNEAGDYHGRPGRTGTARRPPASRKSSTPPRSSRWRSSARSSSARTTCRMSKKVQAGYQAAAALRLSAPARAARRARHRLPADQQGHGEDEFLPVSRLRPAVRARRAGGEGDPRATRPHRHRPGQDVQLQRPDARTQTRSRPRHEGRARERSSGASPTSARRSTAGGSAPRSATATIFNGDWLLRAAAAKAGIYGNDADEAMYPMTRKDATGEPLDGSKHNYTLTFPAGQSAAGERLLVGDDV